MNWTQQDLDDLYRRRQFPQAEKFPPVKLRAHGSHTPGKMNKTEAAFAQHLDLLVKAGEINQWFFEQITLKLAADCRYTPDYSVIRNDVESDPTWALTFYEVKARRKGRMFAEDDSKVKIKVAASMFPFRFFYAVPKSNGDWEEIEVPRL